MKLLPKAFAQLAEGGPLASIPPVATLALALTCCLAATFVERTPAPRSTPLAGVLPDPNPEQRPAAPADAPREPRIELSVSPSARSRFPQGSSFVVHIVEVSTFTVTLARPEPGLAPLRSRAPKVAVPRTSKAPEVLPAPAPLPEPTPAVMPSPSPAPLPAPEARPTQPRTFVEFDEALRASPTTETINLRLKRSGVTFRATHVGRLGERSVVRFAIANEEASDFFLSVVNVSADRTPVHAETAGPYACSGGQEVFGIVHFATSDVAGRRVTVELVQSGGQRRHFELNLDYRF